MQHGEIPAIVSIQRAALLATLLGLALLLVVGVRRRSLLAVLAASRACMMFLPRVHFSCKDKRKLQPLAAPSLRCLCFERLGLRNEGKKRKVVVRRRVPQPPLG